jgi:hypothetical protein
MADRDERGRLLPGHSLHGGRQRRAQEIAALDAVCRAAPPDKIEEALEQMFALAQKYESWKAYDAWLTLVLAYQLGKPTIKVERVEGDPISAALEELRRIHADKQTTYTVIDAAPDAGISSENEHSHK